MNERERHIPNGSPSDPSTPGPGGGNLNAIRQQGEAFFAAGDAAIDNVLSGDSAKFNQAARQQGGQ